MKLVFTPNADVQGLIAQIRKMQKLCESQCVALYADKTALNPSLTLTELHRTFKDPDDHTVYLDVAISGNEAIQRYENSVDLETRQVDCALMLSEAEDAVPLVVQKAPQCKLANKAEAQRLAMRDDRTVEDVINKVKLSLGMTDNQPLYLYAGKTELGKGSVLKQIHLQHADPADGFLYLDFSDHPIDFADTPTKVMSNTSSLAGEIVCVKSAEDANEEIFDVMKSLQDLSTKVKVLRQVDAWDEKSEVEILTAARTLMNGRPKVSQLTRFLPDLVQELPEHYSHRTKLLETVRVKSESGFVGLTNQGATCYMNSLLQILFMTIEFRRELFSWHFPTEQQTPTNIPFQLQKLFAHLQRSDTGVQTTAELTRSFGWDRSDSVVQHDVQELNRVLFDALQKYVDNLAVGHGAEAQSPSTSGFLAELYEGTLVDYIQCLHCKGGSRRVNAYQDVSLVIRGIRSLEESLDQFVQPELLSGSNQYHCETCQAKRDANKGLSFQTFPRILTFQLCRFEYTLMGRVKLNDEVQVPLTLEVSRWLSNPPDPDQTTQSNSTMYDLFSVLVHRGTALGGHYFAYIRTLHDDIWYCFNDEQITRVSVEELNHILHLQPKSLEENVKARETQGAVANPYILVYRSRALPKPDYTTCTVPPSLQERIDAENQEFEKTLAEYQRVKDLLELKVYAPNLDIFKWVVVHKQDTLMTVTEKAYGEVLGLEQRADIPLNCVRLRKYNSKRNVKGPSFLSDDENKPICELGLEALSALALDVKMPGAEWKPISIDDLCLDLRLWDPATQKFEKKVGMVSGDTTFDELLTDLSILSGWPKEDLVVSYPDWECQPVVINHATAMPKRLNPDLDVTQNHTLFVERVQHYAPSEKGSVGSHGVDFIFSEWSIDVHYNLPDELEETTQTFQIYAFSPLSDLKPALAKKLGIDMSEFKLKAAKTSKSEIDDSVKGQIWSLLSLKEQSTRSLTVFVETQPRPDMLSVCLHKYTAPCDGIKFLYKCVQPRDITVADFKLSVAEKLHIPATHLRLREICEWGDKARSIKICRKALLHGLVVDYFKNSAEGALVHIAVQELPEADPITSSDLILRVTEISTDLDPLAAFASMREVIVPRTSTVTDLRLSIAKQHPWLASLENDFPIIKVGPSFHPVPGFFEAVALAYTLQTALKMAITEFPFEAVDGDTFAYRITDKDQPRGPPSQIKTEKGVHITTEFDLPCSKRLATEARGVLVGNSEGGGGEPHPDPATTAIDVTPRSTTVPTGFAG